MAQEKPVSPRLSPHEKYHLRTVEILDDWKSGVISETEANQNHDDAVAVMCSELYESWRTRMAVLDAWCTTHRVSGRRPLGW